MDIRRELYERSLELQSIVVKANPHLQFRSITLYDTVDYVAKINHLISTATKDTGDGVCLGEDFAEVLYKVNNAIEVMRSASTCQGSGGECTEPGRELHLCPYQNDVNESDRLCNCCMGCSVECANDV